VICARLAFENGSNASTVVTLRWLGGDAIPGSMAYQDFLNAPRADRRAIAAENALALGAPALELVEGDAPAALAGLRAPDAVFIGGGIGMATVETAIAALKPLGRLVANAVTLESEAVLLDAFARHGGELERISVQAAEPVGPYHGWRASMPVTQWSWQKALTA
jgi:precorrin-6Y C5,15-methyltransferase (decarboxylating)